MKTPRRVETSGSRPEMMGVLAAGLLCTIALIAHAQTTPAPAPEKPHETVTPATSVGATRRPASNPVQPKVLADPDTRMYSKCAAEGEHDDESQYERPPKAELMTEDEAKARGFRAGAHKVSCK